MDGSVTQMDRVEAQPFRQPAGVCVGLPGLIIQTQAACETDVASFKSRYLAAGAKEVNGKSSPTKINKNNNIKGNAVNGTSTATIKCKLGPTSAVILTDEQSCINAEGTVL
jgi:hypothetical protein